ncbi:MAG: hypothetical protein O2955_12175 [Planctomycetota bacterium]|nr:hypothetical protein [Planctomycetota bacterium]MDA1213268.1 hypothetical protein [Planctomycetota bacterium]
MRWKLGFIVAVFAVATTGLWKTTKPTAMVSKSDPSIVVASVAARIPLATREPSHDLYPAYLFSVQDDTDDDDAVGDSEAEAADTIDPNTPLLVEPTDPEKVFDAVLLMMDLGRMNLAKSYLVKFLKGQPDDETLLAIRQKHGPATFLKLSNLEAMQPASLQLLDMINQATMRTANDPERVKELFQQLLKDDSVDRRAAIQQLRVAGARAMPYVISSLGELSQNERDALLDATGQMGESVIPPLVAATDSQIPVIQNFAIDALGLIGTSETLPYLWYYAASPEVADGTRHSALLAMGRIMRIASHKMGDISLYGTAKGLRDLARARYREMVLGTAGPNETTTYWRWDDEAQSVAAAEMTVSTAKMLEGSRFARQALALAPEQEDAQVLVLSLALAADALVVGTGQPLPTGPGTAHDLALSSGPELVSNVLTSAMAEGNAAVSAAALDVLKSIGSRNELGSHAGKPSAILSALNYPDDRVQFAAANAVLHLDPDTTFRGAGRVVQILSRALVDNGSARAVIVDADRERSGKLKAFLGGMNYDAVALVTGKEGFTEAAERIDVELILLHVNTIEWGLGQTLANLRADARTASLPIIVYGEDSYRAKITEQLKSYPNSTFIAASSSQPDFEYQVGPFLASRRSPPLTPEQRQHQREAAVYWLAHIANGRRTNIYDLASAEEALFGAVEDPAVTHGIILAMGAISTRTAQNNLAEIVLNPRLSNEHREIAALQLVFHIQRFSMTLSETTLKELNDVYQQVDDAGLKTALTALQGSLNPTADQVSERLQRYSSRLPAPAGVTPPAAEAENEAAQPME